MRAYSKVFAIYLACAALLTWMLFAFGLVEMMELPGFEGTNSPSKPTVAIAERVPDAPPSSEKSSKPRGPDVAAVPDRLLLPGPVPPAVREPAPTPPPKAEIQSAPVTTAIKPEPAPASPPARPSTKPAIEAQRPVEIEVAKVPQPAPPVVAPPPATLPPITPPPTAAAPAKPPVKVTALPKTVTAPPPPVITPPPPAPPKAVMAPPPAASPKTVELVPTLPPQRRPGPVIEAAPQTRAAPGKWAPARRIAGFGADALVDQIEDPRRTADDVPCVVFEQMKFRTGTALPSNGTGRQIALIAEALAAHPPIRVEIGSRIGTNRLTAANRNLSVERAAYVRNAIMARGVPVERMAVDTEAGYHILMDDLGRLGMARSPSIGLCIRPATS